MVLSDSIDGSQFSWNRAPALLEILSSLSYRAGDLKSYLTEIACGVSHLLAIEWSVVTCCARDQAKVMASSIDLGTQEQMISLHGTLTQTVVKTGKSLCVRDASRAREYGLAPEGYRSYLGIPLRTPGAQTIGTICCFGKQPREFTAEELKTAELFAERAAIAIDNYNLYQQQRDFNQALEIQVAKRTAELKAAQAKLIEQEKLAAIGQFASMIVHEIRNPTTTILMGLNALSKLELSHRDRLRLSLALEEGDRLQHLLTEILLYAKPQILKSEAIELNQFLSKMLLALREMPQAAQRQIKLIPLKTPVTITGDLDKLKQVIINLVKNACEAISPGETVTAHLARNSQKVRVSIHNDGTPIPPAIVPKLTEPFVSHKSGGTGLGLAIVKQIITAHQGTLSIKSTAETGTIISFTLPIQKTKNES